MTQENLIEYLGGCHCGRIRFRVTASADPVVAECNCSICAKSGFLHLIVPEAGFTLMSGADDLVTYRFNTGAARHLFCAHCGIKSFYYPRSHPGGVSVNARCLDSSPLPRMRIEPFDGRNWEQAMEAGTLAPL